MLWEFYQESLNQEISHRMLHPVVHTVSLSMAVPAERMSMSVLPCILTTISVIFVSMKRKTHYRL